MDKTTTKELLEFILTSIVLIKRRFDIINSGDDFLHTDDGLDKLDSISMRLLAIGEALKNIDKREQDFLLEVADKIYWSKIIKTREILTHHYVDIDSETVYEICDTKLEELNQNILKLKNNLNKERI